jgi:hypothetical protein
VLLAKCYGGREFLYTAQNMLRDIRAVRPIAQIDGELLSIASRTPNTRLDYDPGHTATSILGVTLLTANHASP